MRRILEKFEVINVLKAIIASYDGGIPIEKIEDEYEMWEYEPIPYLRLGYNSLLNLIQSIKDIKVSKNSEGESVFVLKERKNKDFDDYARNQSFKPKIKSVRRNIRFEPHKRRIEQKNKYYSESSGYYSFEEEKLKSPQILIEPNKNLVDVHEPIINGQQLIGDDFFLQLAIKETGATLWRKSAKSALGSGLCISGQKIRDCNKRLKSMSSLSNRVIIQLGSVDIYESSTLEKMKEDFLELLQILEDDFDLAKSAITIGTIPPLANVSFMTQFEEYSTHACFNNWLRQLVYNQYDVIRNKYCRYNIIDFHKEFTNDVGGIEYDYFQENARNVSGTQHGYVLFNQNGRSKAVDLMIIRKKHENYDYFPLPVGSENPSELYF